MTRNLKALGLALAAVFAMSAVVASAASAQSGMLTSDGPVTLTAENTKPTEEEPEPGPNALTAPEIGTVTCPNAKYFGHKHDETPHVLIPNGASNFTVSAEYGLCTGPLGLRTTVDMNDCDYDFNLGGTVAEAEYEVTATVTCNSDEEHINVTEYASVNKHNEEIAFCKQTITHDEEKEYKGLTAIDNGDGTGRIVGSIEEITTDSEGSFPCPNKTGEKDVTSELHVDITVTGDNEEGEPTSISLSHE